MGFTQTNSPLSSKTGLPVKIPTDFFTSSFKISNLKLTITYGLCRITRALSCRVPIIPAASKIIF